MQSTFQNQRELQDMRSICGLFTVDFSTGENGCSAVDSNSAVAMATVLWIRVMVKQNCAVDYGETTGHCTVDHSSHHGHCAVDYGDALASSRYLVVACCNSTSNSSAKFSASVKSMAKASASSVMSRACASASA